MRLDESFVPPCQYPNMVRLGVAMDAVACLSVNDPYVVGCWGQAHGADGKIVMLADPKGEFVEQTGLGLDLTESLGDVRSKRSFDWSSRRIGRERNFFDS